jgi:hypothetical protein
MLKPTCAVAALVVLLLSSSLHSSDGPYNYAALWRSWGSTGQQAYLNGVVNGTLNTFLEAGQAWLEADQFFVMGDVVSEIDLSPTAVLASLCGLHGMRGRCPGILHPVRNGGLYLPWRSPIPPGGLVTPSAPESTPASVTRPPGLSPQIPSPGPPGQIQSP